MENQLAVIDQNQLLLPLPAGVKFTSRRLEMPDELSFQSWMDIGRFLVKSAEAIHFWVPDYIERGRKLFGDDRVRDGLRQMCFPHSDFKKAQLLAGLPVRDPDLTPEHHFVLAKAHLDDVARDMWVQNAKANQLTAADLQESIRKGTVTKIPRNEGAGAAGVTTWGGIRMQFDLIRRRIGDEWKTWNLAETERVLNELAGITRFAGDLAWHKRDLLTKSGKETEKVAA